MSRRPDDGQPLRQPRVLPTEAEIADAIAEASGGTVGALTSRAQKIARAVLALFASQPTEQAVRADEALLIVGQRDRGRGFDQLLREQLQDPEVRAGYVAGRLRQIKAEALREESHYLRERISDATAARNRFDPDSQQWAEFDQGIRRMAEEANRLSLRANRIESEG